MTIQPTPFGRILSHDDDGRRFLRVLEQSWYQALAVLQDRVTVFTTEFWAHRGVRALHLPLTSAAVSSPMGRGSDSTPVEIKMFGVTTHLADSMQFALEYGCRLAPAGSWYLMPSFRGEPADSTHLCEFFHSEVELPTDLDGCIQTAEAYVRALAAGILESVGNVVAAHAGTVEHLADLVTVEFSRMTFEEAAKELSSSPEWVYDSADGWRSLTRAGQLELIRREGRPVWVTHWDHLAVPFYQAFDSGDESRARNADLLFGVGEVLGLGERHFAADDLRRALALHEVDPAPYRWYIDLQDGAPMRTSGFGMGVERFLAWVLRHDDVRDLQLLPRHNGVELVP